MAKQHAYRVTTTWTGNLGSGTAHYGGYSRDHQLSANGKSAPVLGSSDPSFRGDASRYNPEELLVASLSSCHMLWVLHLCAEAGIVVSAYVDEAVGTMEQTADGGGQFTQVTLKPRMTLAQPERIAEARVIHQRAHQLCFIARSVNFPVLHEPEVTAGALQG